jgi:hypothetical protein
MRTDLTRQWFLRLVGVVFLIAFVSYWTQLPGLVGSKGILPASELMASARSLGAAGIWRAPTLCWFSTSDTFLHLLAGTGTAVSLLLIAGILTGPMMLAAWAIYLSLVVVGQTFFNFQWDILLLETALTSLFIAPWSFRAPRRHEPHAGLWLVRLLLFKLMVLSGITKLICLDPTWWGRTALDYHYFTQPLPVWTSWYAHAMPAAFRHFSVALMFTIELGVPFLVFAGRRLRVIGAFAILFLQALIALTGNYGFFNILTVVLCVTWLDDAFLLRLIPARWRPTQAEPPPNAAPKLGVRVVYGVAVALFAYASSVAFVDEMVRTRPQGQIHGVAGALLDAGAVYASLGQPLSDAIEPFRSISGYGLFRTMTTARPEVIVEISDDGTTWHELVFRYKVGDVHRRPMFVAPHQPRLDWQMWFAALSPRRASGWLERFLLRLLEGSPAVVHLLDDPGLHDKPPRFVRLVMYDYTFTTREEAAQNLGAWWKRERRGEMTQALSLDSFKR